LLEFLISGTASSRVCGSSDAKRNGMKGRMPCIGMIERERGEELGDVSLRLPST
jgi:hypothetical protein